MALKRSRQTEAEINVASFSDIAFLLIIFFILTTQFVKPAGNNMSIPSGSTDPSKKQEKYLTINLSAEKILWDGKDEMSLDDLRRRLLQENLKEKPPEQRVIILDAGRDVAYQRYFEVVTAIANADGVLALIEHEEKQAGGAASPSSAGGEEARP